VDGRCLGVEVAVFRDLEEIAPQRIWAGVLGRAIHGERITLSVVELTPNALIPEHSHENEQLGMTILGSLTFRVSKEERSLGAGGTWRIKAHAPHEVRVGPEGAVVVETFSPCRVDWMDITPERRQKPRWPLH
jgi:quercetin dioxygenase-like cupin family protein